MAESISFDYSNAMFMVDESDIVAMKDRVLEAKKSLIALRQQQRRSRAIPIFC